MFRFQYNMSECHIFTVNRTAETNTSIKSQDDKHSSAESSQSLPIKSLSRTKSVLIEGRDKITFAKYNSYIMIPWFVLSDILNELNEEKIKALVSIILTFIFQRIFVSFVLISGE